MSGPSEQVKGFFSPPFRTMRRAWPAFWSGPAPTTRRFEPGSKQLLHPFRNGVFSRPPRSATLATVDEPRSRRTGHGHRPVQAAAADRRRRHGRRLHGRADAAGQADGGAQDHQARHGLPAGRRPFRGRAAGPGPDGSSEHRPGVRRRTTERAGHISSWNWSRACRSPNTATSTADAEAAAGAVHPGLPGDPARAPEGDHPSRHQALQRAGRRCTTASRCPR